MGVFLWREIYFQLTCLEKVIQADWFHFFTQHILSSKHCGSDHVDVESLKTLLEGAIEAMNAETPHLIKFLLPMLPDLIDQMIIPESVADGELNELKASIQNYRPIAERN